MISESYIWKDELYKNYKIIATFSNKTFDEIEEEEFFETEKAIMFSAYIIRKLNDAQKIPSELWKKNVSIIRHKSLGHPIHKFNCIDIEKNYDLQNKEKENNKLGCFLDTIIHSYVFEFSYSENNKPDGIFVNSNNTKNNYLYYIPFKFLFELFLSISEGYIVSAEWNYDEKKQETIIKNCIYEYPKNFDMKKIIKDTSKGIIYVRPDNQEFESITLEELKQKFSDFFMID